MIKYLFSGYYVFREDAYRDYCWAVDAYGAYQPASFIYLCFEAFRDFLQASDIDLVPALNDLGLTETRAFPMRAESSGVSSSEMLDGLIIRVTSLSDSILIRKYLEHDKNVVALIPKEVALLDKAARANAEVVFGEFGLDISGEGYQETGPNTKGTPFFWTELQVPKGRLFVGEDGLFSDGTFMSGYGKSDETDKLLESIRVELGRFKSNFLRLYARNWYGIWPCNAPLSVMLGIKNHGPDSPGGRLTLVVPETFEPLSALEVQIPAQKSGSRFSFGVQLIPRYSGEFPDFLQISRAETDLLGICLDLPENRILVAESFLTTARSQGMQDTQGLAHLKEVAKDHRDIIEPKSLETLAELLKIDSAACLNKIRTIAEGLAKRVSRRTNATFADNIKCIQDRRSLSARSVGYLHTIRVLGNLASHPSNEALTESDVRIAAFALASVVEDLISRPNLFRTPQTEV